MTKEEFESYVKTVIPEKSVVIVQAPDSLVPDLTKSLYELSNNLSHLQVLFLTCPDHFKITVIPQGTDVKIE